MNETYADDKGANFLILEISSLLKSLQNFPVLGILTFPVLGSFEKKFLIVETNSYIWKVPSYRAVPSNT